MWKWLVLLAALQSAHALTIQTKHLSTVEDGMMRLEDSREEQEESEDLAGLSGKFFEAGYQAGQVKFQKQIQELRTTHASANAIKAAQTAQKLDAAQTQLAATQNNLTAALKASVVQKQKREEQLAKDAEQDAKMQQTQEAAHRAAVNASQVKCQKQIQELRTTHASANAIKAAQTAQKLDAAQTQLAATQNHLTAALKASVVQKQKREEQLAKDAERKQVQAQAKRKAEEKTADLSLDEAESAAAQASLEGSLRKAREAKTELQRAKRAVIEQGKVVRKAQQDLSTLEKRVAANRQHLAQVRRKIATAIAAAQVEKAAAKVRAAAISQKPCPVCRFCFACQARKAASRITAGIMAQIHSLQTQSGGTPEQRVHSGVLNVCLQLGKELKRKAQLLHNQLRYQEKKLVEKKAKVQKLEQSSNICGLALGSQVRVASFNTTVRAGASLLGSSEPDEIQKSSGEIKFECRENSYGNRHHAFMRCPIPLLREAEGTAEAKDATRILGFCVIPEGQKVPEKDNAHMYCASDTQTQKSFVTACTSIDNGQILVKNMIDQKMEMRDQKGVKTSLCINYIKVAACSDKIMVGGLERRSCAEKKLITKCVECPLGEEDCNQCKSRCRIKSTISGGMSV